MKGKFGIGLRIMAGDYIERHETMASGSKYWNSYRFVSRVPVL